MSSTVHVAGADVGVLRQNSELRRTDPNVLSRGKTTQKQSEMRIKAPRLCFILNSEEVVLGRSIIPQTHAPIEALHGRKCGFVNFGVYLVDSQGYTVQKYRLCSVFNEAPGWPCDSYCKSRMREPQWELEGGETWFISWSWRRTRQANVALAA